MNKLIASFAKNALEEVHVSLTEYRGRDLVDIRTYYTDDEGEKKPTKKGISLSVDLFLQLKDAVLKVEEVLRDEGMIEEE